MTTISDSASTLGNCLVMDIGKTNCKLHLVTPDDQMIVTVSKPNAPLNQAPYPHADVEGIWQWLIENLKAICHQHPIHNIVVTTHGATAALIDRHSPEQSSGLVLNVLDYEFEDINQLEQSYAAVRPNFNHSYSPDLPAGLNLGRQLFWLQQNYSRQFNQATDILLYPQYWAWRLSDQLSTEVSSLGCHTDLWSPLKQDYSDLVDNMGWRSLFPSIKPAWSELALIKPDIAKATGISNQCKVFTGVHDSNASFLRYRMAHSSQPFCVVSSGTWAILMASGCALTQLQAKRDMLLNVDVWGEPVACARFMGGREYHTVCNQLGDSIETSVSSQQLQKLIDSLCFALPCFSQGSGPFAQNIGQIIGAVQDSDGAALATLYYALMLSYQLDKLEAKGAIYIEGALVKNPTLCALLAQLRPTQTVFLSADESGTVLGSASLSKWHKQKPKLALNPIKALELEGLFAYQDAWRLKAETDYPQSKPTDANSSVT